MKVAEIQLVYKTKVNPKDRVKISGSKDAITLLKDSWDNIELSEVFKILLLNRANKVLGIYELSKGSVTGTMIEIKHIFVCAIKANASSIILAHNHPSGNYSPSESDIRLTKKVIEAGKIMDVAILDHIIITTDKCYSMQDKGNVFD